MVIRKPEYQKHLTIYLIRMRMIVHQFHTNVEESKIFYFI